MKPRIIQRGAEAVLIKHGDEIVKQRVVKGHRFPELDEQLRRARTRSEAKLLERARQIIHVPRVLKVNEKTKEIELEFIDGAKLSEHLDNLKNRQEICVEIGKSVAALHDAGIIHGDLTTSNMIWVETEEKLYFIDFGLGFFSNNTEDKAVDLHLLKEALEARHFSVYVKCWSVIADSYKKNSRAADDVFRRLERVEKRGRYKEQY